MKQQNNIEWKEVEFGDSEYFEVKKGESITRDKVTEGKIPVVAGGQQPAYYHNKSNRPGETITISGSGAYAGFVNYFKGPIFASDCSTVQIKNDLISQRYAYLFLKSCQSKIYSMQKGIAQPHVYPKDIVKIKIPLPFFNGKPDIKEQERIVQILEKAEKLKERGNNAKDLLNEYLKSVFNEMFIHPIKNTPWDFEVVDKICNLVRGSSPRPQGDPRYYGGKVPRLMVSDITRDGMYTTPKIDFLTEEGAKLSRPMKKGEVIMAVSGNPGLPTILTVDACIHDGFVGFRDLDKRVKPEYLYYYLSVYKDLHKSQSVVRSEE